MQKVLLNRNGVGIITCSRLRGQPAKSSVDTLHEGVDASLATPGSDPSTAGGKLDLAKKGRKMESPTRRQDFTGARDCIWRQI